jgi:hypothetical protein
MDWILSFEIEGWVGVDGGIGAIVAVDVVEAGVTVATGIGLLADPGGFSVKAAGASAGKVGAAGRLHPVDNSAATTRIQINRCNSIIPRSSNTQRYYKYR